LLERDTIETDVENIIGGQAGDILNGNDSDNVLSGGPGDDTLIGGLGSDIFNGEAGNDTVSYADKTADVTANLDGLIGDGTAGENDTIATDVERLTGGSGNDTLIGNDAANILSGGAGDDFMQGYALGDTFVGGSGIDTVSYAEKNTAVVANLDGVAGDGTVGEGDTVGLDVENLVGGSGDDTLIGNANANVLTGGPGADIMNGAGGIDTVSYVDHSANVTANLDGLIGDGAAGENDIIGSDVENLIGGSGNDSLTGSNVANTLFGADGNDVLIGGLGADIINGGNGSDTVSYAEKTSAVSVYLDGATKSGTMTLLGVVNENDIVGADVENIVATAYNDTLVGNSSANTIDAGPGDDSLAGLLGDDIFNGGTGADTVTYAEKTTPVIATIGGTGGTSVGSGGAQETDTIGSDIENLIGGSAGDTLIGDDKNNTLSGGGGDDTLQGLLGADVLTGGAGSDTVTYAEKTGDVLVSLNGLVGDDGTPVVGTAPAEGDTVSADVENIIGGAGDDTLTGDANANVLNGGPGQDLLVGLNGADSFVGGAGNDTVSYAERTVAVVVLADGTVGASGNPADGILGARDTVGCRHREHRWRRRRRHTNRQLARQHLYRWAWRRQFQRPGRHRHCELCRQVDACDRER